jgi:hypothetical protein
MTKGQKLQLSKLSLHQLKAIIAKVARSGVIQIDEFAFNNLTKERALEFVMLSEVEKKYQFEQLMSVAKGAGTSEGVKTNGSNEVANLITRAKELHAEVDKRFDDVNGRMSHQLNHIEQTLQNATADIQNALKPDPNVLAELVSSRVSEILNPYLSNAKPEQVQAVAEKLEGAKFTVKTAGEVFGSDVCQYTLNGNLEDFTEFPVNVFNHPKDDTFDEDYIFDPMHLHQTLISLSHGALPDNLWLAGHRGTGKTQFINNLGSRLGLNVVRVNFSEGTDDALIGGMTSKDGNIEWSEGIVSTAIQKAVTIVLFDEVSCSRPRQVLMLQAVVEVAKGRGLTIAETGKKIPVADYVCFAVADNTRGYGDETGGHAGTLEQNSAFVDRFNPCMEFHYLPKAKEVELLVKKTGVRIEVAKNIVEFATTARQKSKDGLLTQPPSIRQLLTLARSCQKGLPFYLAFRNSIINKYPADCAPELEAIRKTKIDEKVFTVKVS